MKTDSCGRWWWCSSSLTIAAIVSYERKKEGGGNALSLDRRDSRKTHVHFLLDRVVEPRQLLEFLSLAAETSNISGIDVLRLQPKSVPVCVEGDLDDDAKWREDQTRLVEEEGREEGARGWIWLLRWCLALQIGCHSSGEAESEEEREEGLSTTTAKTPSSCLLSLLPDELHAGSKNVVSSAPPNVEQPDS